MSKCVREGNVVDVEACERGKVKNLKCLREGEVVNVVVCEKERSCKCCSV